MHDEYALFVNLALLYFLINTMITAVYLELVIKKDIFKIYVLNYIINALIAYLFFHFMTSRNLQYPVFKGFWVTIGFLFLLQLFFWGNYLDRIYGFGWVIKKINIVVYVLIFSAFSAILTILAYKFLHMYAHL